MPVWYKALSDSRILKTNRSFSFGNIVLSFKDNDFPDKRFLLNIWKSTPVPDFIGRDYFKSGNPASFLTWQIISPSFIIFYAVSWVLFWEMYGRSRIHTVTICLGYIMVNVLLPPLRGIFFYIWPSVFRTVFLQIFLIGRNKTNSFMFQAEINVWHLLKTPL